MSDQDSPWTLPSPPTQPTQPAAPIAAPPPFQDATHPARGKPTPLGASQPPPNLPSHLAPGPQASPAHVPVAPGWGGGYVSGPSEAAPTANSWPYTAPGVVTGDPIKSAKMWPWVIVAAVLLASCVAVGAFVLGKEFANDGAGAQSQSIELTDAVVGTCFDWDYDSFEDAVFPVLCNEEHEGEVMNRLDLTEDLNPSGDYPGDAQFQKLGYVACEDSFEAYVGLAYTQSELIVQPFGPYTESEFDVNPTITCVVSAWDYEPMTEPARLSGR